MVLTYKVVVSDNGTKCWFFDDKLHREDGPAVEYADGTKNWYIKGKHHREDGPAVKDIDGYKAWYINGKLHREDGPAVEYADGSKNWYINDNKLTELEFLARQPCTDKTVVIDGKAYKLVAI